MRRACTVCRVRRLGQRGGWGTAFFGVGADQGEEAVMALTRRALLVVALLLVAPARSADGDRAWVLWKQACVNGSRFGTGHPVVAARATRTSQRSSPEGLLETLRVR